MKKFMKKLDKFMSITKKVCNVLLTIISACETISSILA